MQQRNSGPHNEDRLSPLLARLRHRQLKLALQGAVRESAQVAEKVRRVRHRALQKSADRVANTIRV